MQSGKMIDLVVESASAWDVESEALLSWVRLEFQVWSPANARINVNHVPWIV